MTKTNELRKTNKFRILATNKNGTMIFVCWENFIRLPFSYPFKDCKFKLQQFGMKKYAKKYGTWLEC